MKRKQKVVAVVFALAFGVTGYGLAHLFTNSTRSVASVQSIATTQPTPSQAQPAASPPAAVSSAPVTARSGRCSGANPRFCRRTISVEPAPYCYAYRPLCHDGSVNPRAVRFYNENYRLYLLTDLGHWAKPIDVCRAVIVIARRYDTTWDVHAGDPWQALTSGTDLFIAYHLEHWHGGITPENVAGTVAVITQEGASCAWATGGP